MTFLLLERIECIMSIGETENNKSKFDSDKYLDGMVEHITEKHAFDKLNEHDRAILIFALGRCYAHCQYLATLEFGGFRKNAFLETAKKLGAEIKITEF